MEKECINYFCFQTFYWFKVSFPDLLQKPGTAGNMIAEH